MDSAQLAAFAALLSREVRTKFPTWSAFCQAADITRTTLRSLLSGTQHPSPETLEKLATALRTTTAELTGQKRIKADDPLLADLIEEDLHVAQMFHHAGLTVKQRTLGTLQERQPPHGIKRDLSADVTTWAQRLLALAPEQRHVVSTLIVALETPSGSTAPLTPDVLAWAQRLQALPDALRPSATEAIENLENVQKLPRKTRTHKPLNRR